MFNHLFDLCQVVSEKIGDHDVPDRRTSLNCHLHTVSIYDDNVDWTNANQELDDSIEAFNLKATQM